MQHGQDVVVRAAVSRSLESGDSRDDGGVEIGHGGDGHAGCERRGIELMVRVERQHDIHGPADLGGRLPPVEQVEEARGVRTGGSPSERLAAGADALPRGDGLRHERHEPERLAQVRPVVARSRVRIAGRRQ